MYVGTYVANQMPAMDWGVVKEGGMYVNEMLSDASKKKFRLG